MVIHRHSQRSHDHPQSHASFSSANDLTPSSPLFSRHQQTQAVSSTQSSKVKQAEFLKPDKPDENASETGIAAFEHAAVVLPPQDEHTVKTTLTRTQPWASGLRASVDLSVRTKLKELLVGIRKGDRASLASAITLGEKRSLST